MACIFAFFQCCRTSPIFSESEKNRCRNGAISCAAFFSTQNAIWSVPATFLMSRLLNSLAIPTVSECNWEMFWKACGRNERFSRSSSVKNGGNRYWRKKLPRTILEDQFPLPRYTAASKIGNSVFLLLRLLRCRCNRDHNKFKPLSNTTVVAIFHNLCLWARSLCSNLGDIDPEKLYRATF